MSDTERTEQIISTVENEMGFQLRPEQRQIVISDGYPLFLLFGMPRRWGKTTVAILWALVHGPDIISLGAEKGIWTAMRNGYTEKRHVYLPDLPDPDILWHPIMLHEGFRDLRRLSSVCSSAGLIVPIVEIKNRDIDFFRKEFFVPNDAR